MTSQIQNQESALPAKPETMVAEAPIAYNPSWSEHTLRAAYDDATRMLGVDVSWAESLDTKIVATFSVSSAVVGLAPSLASGEKSVETWLFWILALVFWAWAAWQCYRAFEPRDFTVGPSPGKTLDPKWLSLDLPRYYFYSIRDASDAHDANRALIAKKAGHLTSALFASALEVFCLAIAFFVF